MKYFFAGIKGSGMAGLACMLKNLGNEVIGCDDAKVYTFTEDALYENDIKVYKDAYFLTSDMIFIYTAAIHEDHYAYKKAKELNCKMYGYFEFIGELTKKYKTICVSGSHGKTTTTALLSHIFKNTIKTNYLIGDGTGFVDKTSSNFVVESCEFERHFLNYYPKYAIITNIDYDHVDCYKSPDEYREVFGEFISNVSDKVVACGDDAEIRKLKSDKIVYYGFNKDNDVVCKNAVFTPEGSSFDVYIDKKFYGHFKLNLYGKHMLLDALACIYMCYLENIDVDLIIENINNFKGAKRRFSETKIGNNIIVDDYAHHPNEVKTVIETARQKYPTKQVVAVLIPYTISRTKAFYKDFADVLKKADKVFVTDIEPARESFEDYPGVTSNLIIDLIPNAEHISKEEISKLYKYDNAVIPFMGCKDPTWLIDAYKEGLK